MRRPSPSFSFCLSSFFFKSYKCREFSLLFLMLASLLVFLRPFRPLLGVWCPRVFFFFRRREFLSLLCFAAFFFLLFFFFRSLYIVLWFSRKKRRERGVFTVHEWISVCLSSERQPPERRLFLTSFFSRHVLILSFLSGEEHFFPLFMKEKLDQEPR